MARYIDADALYRKVVGYNGGAVDKTVAKRLIEQMPTADVRKNVRGEWKKDGRYMGLNWYRCSACEYAFSGENVKEWNFCPNCGADMRGKQDEIH